LRPQGFAWWAEDGRRQTPLSPAPRAGRHRRGVGDQLTAPDDWHAKSVDLDVHPLDPRLPELHTIHRGDHIDTVGRDTDLVDRASGLEIGGGEPMTRRAEDVERLQHAGRVVRGRAHPEVEALGRTRQPVRRHRVSPDEQELNAGVDERGQYVAEVGIEHRGHQ
jgi:hypothetical protein